MFKSVNVKICDRPPQFLGEQFADAFVDEALADVLEEEVIHTEGHHDMEFHRISPLGVQLRKLLLVEFSHGEDTKGQVTGE